jgi:hypothetical protein
MGEVWKSSFHLLGPPPRIYVPPGGYFCNIRVTQQQVALHVSETAERLMQNA